jgi:hypothetical protein
MGMSDERYKNQSAMASESPPLRTRWTCVLELDATRSVVAGSENTLVDAIRRGADLRIGTEFLHNEHIDVHSESAERIREVAEFGARPSMSFFLYNQNGRQAVARPYLDGVPAHGIPGPAPSESPAEMPKYHTHDSWDEETNAPSGKFIYDFDVYRCCDPYTLAFDDREKRHAIRWFVR